MKFFYQEYSLKPGIYKILNTHTNRVYIGQAKRFKERWKAHIKTLLNGKHQNKFLQADFNKSKEELGHDDFLEFHVIELMTDSNKTERNQREEFYINAIWDQQKQCYNFQRTTSSSQRRMFSKTPNSTTLLKSKNTKRLWCSEEFRSKINTMKAREKISNSLKRYMSEQKNLDKRKIFLDSVRPKAIKAQEKHFGIVLAPNGQSYDVTNLAKFCREHGLVVQSMHNVFTRKQKTHRGWRLP